MIAKTSGRVCLGLELDPCYVDLIVTRWERFNGQAASLDSDGRTFTEAEERVAP
jgi:DNA modification methylase